MVEQEYKEFYDLNILGSISIKGTTKEPRNGNPQPRIAECYQGMINSVGLQNPGIKKVVEHELVELKKIYKKPVIANISGFSIDEYVYCSKMADSTDNVGIIEINVSCPNVHKGGMSFGTDPENIYKVTRSVKEVTEKPLYIKLSPNVTDIVEMAKAAESGGADGLTLINTLLGMRIDIRSRLPVIANTMGGFSGPAIFPVALKMIYQVKQQVNLPIMGVGGVSRAEDVIEMMMAGATAVQVGSANLINPFAAKEIIESLPGVMNSLGIKKLTDIIGIAQKG